MADTGFAPLVPRRLGAPVLAPPASMTDEPTPEQLGSAASDVEVAENADTQAQEPIEEAISDASSDDEPVETLAPVDPASSQDQTKPEMVRAPSPPVCDHSIQIRNEAVRLASIACGRALRYAVALHPGVIAAFVDEALAAVAPQRASHILVHPDLTSALGERPFVTGDPVLVEGDLRVELNNGCIEACLDQRAALLVAAAAET